MKESRFMQKINAMRKDAEAQKFREKVNSKKPFDLSNIPLAPNTNTHPTIEQLKRAEEEDIRMMEIVYQEQQSRTWKERHAKGVPVKMDWIRFAKCCSETQAVNGVVRGLQFGEDPIASSVSVGVFCNFRYKQSWLDNKGGEHGVAL